jgi:hypothetical protein
MMIELDENLILQAKRSPRKDGLSEGERIALNLLWRRGVRVPILAKVFQCSKNTVYGNCLTGDAASYPMSNRAREVNETIDRLGVDEAWRQNVTPAMIKAVNAANRELIERRRLPPAQRVA